MDQSKKEEYTAKQIQVIGKWGVMLIKHFGDSKENRVLVREALTGCISDVLQNMQEFLPEVNKR